LENGGAGNFIDFMMVRENITNVCLRSGMSQVAVNPGRDSSRELCQLQKVFGPKKYLLRAIPVNGDVLESH